MRQRNCFASGNNTLYTTRHWLLRISAGLFVSLFPFYSVSAQYRFDSWTTDNGLPQASVNDILQTRDGYLWLATFGGLVRFDGLRFQVFNTGNTKGLRTSRFLRLFEDRAGNLWIITEGQGVTRYKDDSFTTYTTDQGLFSNQVGPIYEDSAGILKLKNGSQLMQWVGETFQPCTPTAGESLTGSFQYTQSGAIWYLENGILHKVENGRITVDLDTDYYVNRFHVDRQGRVWIGTRENRLLIYQNGKLKLYSDKESYQQFPHLIFYEDQKGSLWLGTENEGLFQLKDGKFTRYTTSDGLAGNDVVSIYQDREGTLWVGTTKGLSRMTEHSITTYSIKNGLAADNVYPIYEDRQGQILIGSWGGLTRYANGVFTNVSQQYGVADGKIWITSLLEDRSGGLWIGTYARGVRYARDGKVTQVEPGGKTGRIVHTMIQDRAGNIWFGCADGLIQYKDGAFVTYTTRDGLSGKDISALYEDRQDQLWIGTDAGLTRYRDGVFTAYTEKDGLAGNIVRAIYEDQEGMLWIGMYDSGLYRLKDGHFTHYTAREGLFDNGVFRIIEDSRGNFWISCNLGIYRVRKAELNDLAEGRAAKITSVSYNKRDGMLNAECNGGGQPAGIRTGDGRIWFPTQQGVAVIDPDHLPVNAQPPRVVVESVIVDTHLLATGSDVKLQPGQVNLEIQYTGLSFINPELITFKYKLEGLDEGWIDAGMRRTAYYSHLPPGSYAFRVIAANRDGVWNEVGATIQIMVITPFWRTWWFISGIVLVLAGAFFLWYKRRILQLERAHRAQEEFSRRLIESQEGERKRIAAELHDSLGQGLLIIKNRAALSLKFWDDPAKAREQVEQIEGTAAQSMKEVRQIAYDLRPYQLDDIGLTQALKDLVKNVNGSGPIRFTASIAYMDDLYSIDEAINLYRIVQEAINNIVKHSGANFASVTITRDEGEVEMVITDDGKGGGVEATGANAARRGFGLTGLAERARMLSGKLAVYSTPGQGTTVKLNLRIQEQNNEH